jgi:hypothetical protein
VIVQGGSYAEHDIIEAELNGRRIKINGPHLRVRLAPGAGATLQLAMRRYVNAPTLQFPF